MQYDVLIWGAGARIYNIREGLYLNYTILGGGPQLQYTCNTKYILNRVRPQDQGRSYTAWGIAGWLPRAASAPWTAHQRPRALMNRVEDNLVMCWAWHCACWAMYTGFLFFPFLCYFFSVLLVSFYFSFVFST